MKIYLVLSFVLVTSFSLYGQNDYEMAIKTTLVAFDSSKTPDDMKAAAARFEQIAVAKPQEWLPCYYASYIYCIMAFITNDVTQKQVYIDQSQKQLDDAMKLAPEESEVYTLQGMLYQAYIGLDPMNNGQVYSGKAAGSFAIATKLNPSNPRPYYLQAISIMYTPEQYGGGKKVAYGLFSKANELFAAFVPSSAIAPNWGKEDCARYLVSCSEN
jgi:hypothetical protein